MSPPAAYPPVTASGGCGETRARSLHRCFHPTGPPARVAAGGEAKEGAGLDAGVGDHTQYLPPVGGSEVRGREMAWQGAQGAVGEEHTEDRRAERAADLAQGAAGGTRGGARRGGRLFTAMW
ncbi:hypothetical protein GCM10020227_56550 [Streptomyces flavovirens]